jgi:hypothetical protein
MSAADPVPVATQPNITRSRRDAIDFDGRWWGCDGDDAATVIITGRRGDHAASEQRGGEYDCR